MSICNVFRADVSNVGDWYCAPIRYFPFGDASQTDILTVDPATLNADVVVGGGGLLAQTFHPYMQRLASHRGGMRSLIAWGIGESENIDRRGGFVLPYAGELPSYLSAFDLVGVRDFGTRFSWVPCASCMLSQFDLNYEIETEICIYEHKRIKIPIEGFPRKSNNGNDIDAALKFLSSSELIITNSYHGAYWATLLGRRVITIPNMSKVYRLKHQPIFCRSDDWRRYAALAPSYPEALAECRAANVAFYDKVVAHLSDSCR